MSLNNSKEFSHSRLQAEWTDRETDVRSTASSFVAEVLIANGSTPKTQFNFRNSQLNSQLLLPRSGLVLRLLILRLLSSRGLERRRGSQSWQIQQIEAVALTDSRSLVPCGELIFYNVQQD
ncbi:MAG: hypothetical protein NT070_23470 [Cyanobacteria bacterium]|nr:hypothetical protein [Cyanobacteriota bacterium]